jgi:hypothetical protein
MSPHHGYGPAAIADAIPRWSIARTLRILNEFDCTAASSTRSLRSKSFKIKTPSVGNTAPGDELQ